MELSAARAYVGNVIRYASPRRLRLGRHIALLLLIAYATATAETVVGAVRDGAVHHESTIAALVHQETHHGDHGPEDSGLGAKHGPNHRHGTGADHCTHAHGVSLPTACAFEVPAGAVTETFEVPEPRPAGRAPDTDLRPPRA